MDPAGELTELLEAERKLSDASASSSAAAGSSGSRDWASLSGGERDETLLCAVVEVPLEAPTVSVAGLDDPRARRGQLLAGLGVRQRDGDEPRELLEAFLDAGGEPPGGPTETEVAPQSRPETTIGAATPEVTCGRASLPDVGRLRLQVDPRGGPVCATRAIAPPSNGSRAPTDGEMLRPPSPDDHRPS